MGDADTLFTLPVFEQPPWWLTKGDRPCWYTLRELLQRTKAVVTAAQ